ncbi:hypothetical protein J4573_02565 [Actinomadura barringtoniae]|uniref:Uncharacterized protein n=1 Tax=Actinomadura barringtoniae TaxID=1427535 RepID=A0A939P5Y0_9ACTN|nr:hypothetical protein [Actinomadura barringtoniae]MBO2445962.1 hypothetical protein [Actinomadura barringtoniae]
MITRGQEKAGALVGAVFSGGALAAHFLVGRSLEERLGLVADPWYRREIGTVNAGFLYGSLRLYKGERDITFLRSTGMSALLMAGVRAVATLRGERRGALSFLVMAGDVALGAGAVAVSLLPEPGVDE